MEKVREAVGGVKKKAVEGMLDKVFAMIEDMDAFDQIAELLKTVVPLKAEITVKGKKAVEVRAVIKNGQLWLGFKRIREKPAEAPAEEEPKE